MTDERFSAAINRLFEFVHAVHQYGVRNPDSNTIGRFSTPRAISDINGILKVDRFNSVRAMLRKPRPSIRRKRRVIK